MKLSNPGNMRMFEVINNITCSSGAGVGMRTTAARTTVFLLLIFDYYFRSS